MSAGAAKYSCFIQSLVSAGGSQAVTSKEVTARLHVINIVINYIYTGVEPHTPGPTILFLVGKLSSVKEVVRGFIIIVPFVERLYILLKCILDFWKFHNPDGGVSSQTLTIP